MDDSCDDACLDECKEEVGAAADVLEVEGKRTEAANTRKDGNLGASASEAQRMVADVRKALEGRTRAAAAMVPRPVELSGPDLSSDPSDDDVEISPCIDACAEFFVGMRVMDRVIGGMGRVLEVGESGTSHGGQVRVDYDNKSPARGQPTPLWRTVSGGVVVPAADELDGIRVTAHTRLKYSINYNRDCVLTPSRSPVIA